MRTQSPDTSPEAERVLIDLLRRASPARKFQMIVSANVASRQLALAGLRMRHPQDSPQQLRRRLADLWLGEELAAKAYGPPESDALPEDSVIEKLQSRKAGGSASDGQWRSAIDMLKVRGSALDRGYLEHVGEQLGVGDLLRRAMGEAGLRHI